MEKSLLKPFSARNGFDVQTEKPLLFEQTTGDQVQNIQNTRNWVISYVREDADSPPEIKVYDEEDTLQKGQFTFNGSLYYADPETGVLQTGFQNVPYRGMKNHDLLVYISDLPDDTYGTFQIGRVEFQTAESQVRDRFFISTGDMARNTFQSTNEGIVYCDENGWIAEGDILKNGHHYTTDENGIIQEMDGSSFRVFSETEDGKVRLWVKGTWIYADADTVRADILEKSIGPVRYAEYYSHSRNNPKKLDCLGYSLYVMNRVYHTEFDGDSVDQFYRAGTNGRTVKDSEAEPGDLVLYRGTFLPKEDNYTHYTHAAIYLGDGMVLSMGYDGVSYCAVDSILDYYGKPAPYEFYRLNKNGEDR